MENLERFHGWNQKVAGVGGSRFGIADKNLSTMSRRDFCFGAGNGSRTRILSLARTHNSRYTIPARLLICAEILSNDVEEGKGSINRMRSDAEIFMMQFLFNGRVSCVVFTIVMALRMAMGFKI